MSLSCSDVEDASEMIELNKAVQEQMKRKTVGKEHMSDRDGAHPIHTVTLL